MQKTSVRSIGAGAVALALWWVCGLAMAGDGNAWRWFEGGRPTPQAHEAVELLLGAASHGLEPEDYGASALQQHLARAAQADPLGAQAIAPLDQALTQGMERYLSDLYRGRVDPRRIHENYSVAWPRDFDAAAALQGALSAGRLSASARELWPRLPIYERFREALARYRALGDHPAWKEPLPPLPGSKPGHVGKLEPGMPWGGTALLAQRLAALGDLPEQQPATTPPAETTPPPAPPAPPAPTYYESPLVNAVQAFQQRHGIAADGVIGRGTWAALQVTPAQRARQIELTLERMRWTPLMQGSRMVVVNIPEFVLRAYEVIEGQIVVREEMKVIVGKVLDTRTPLFDEDMRYIEFAPYWNVPPSIARDETVPRLRRDPGYWGREGFEFVWGSGEVQTTLSAAGLDATLAGRARIRQRPGPKNALGDIKFVFPNSSNIYLHHTPSVGLFERERRDFSHGCIRVEKPVELAKFVLKDMPEWTEARILEAMGKEESFTLKLTEPVPVLITYGTTLVRDGRIFFFDDIYGHDRLLDAALRARSAGPLKREATRP
ncbi:MAG: L,D-transpeptidase family protein [Rhizobacter sp.]|nr:L,D-transpeptidase family protein [Rhizobacter sp.]